MTPADPLLTIMHTQSDIWKKENDHRFVFLRCYSMMTANMLQGIAQGRFCDAAWVARLLHHFAGYYFDALRLYEANDDRTPAVWRQVHEASTHHSLHVLQHLLLGINAHINYDLVLAIRDAMMDEWKMYDEATRNMRMADHELVNRIIGETIDAVQDQVIEREAPFMKVVDSLMGRVDEWLLSELITNWRSEVWNESCAMLSAETEEQKELLRLSLEDNVIKKANQMLGF
jgi:hypothetical protein